MQDAGRRIIQSPGGSRSVFVLLLLITAMLTAGAGVRAQSEPPVGPRVQPYREGPQDPLDFRGPGRDEPEPNVREVVLGWFGPGDPNHVEFGTLWRGATLALEEENAAGGYRGARGSQAGVSSGKAFRLEPAWSESPWQAGTAALLRLVYDQQAWAVAGGVDGTTTHLALQVALKSHFLLLTPGSTDVSTDRANVPWLFSLAPSDESLASVVVPALAKAASGGPFAVTASVDHDGHAALAAFRRELGRQRLTPTALIEFSHSGDDLGSAVERLLERGPRAVLVLGPARSAGAFVAALRRAAFKGMIFGSGTAAGRAFQSAAGDAAEGTFAPRSISPGAAWDAFVAAYERRWGDAPDEGAANGYDAVKLTVAAIRRAGLNRARIRDAVRAIAPWNGAGGVVRWDALGRNQRVVVACSWRSGHLIALN